MTIPIANIYYLLLYAWRHVERRDLVDAGNAGKSDLLNLLAHVYTLEVRRLIARGLSREYVTLEQEIIGLRGKLEMGPTLKRDLLRQGRTWCAFDEILYDVPRNRIIKATLRLLLRVPKLDRDNRDAARSLYAKLDSVRDVTLHPSLFRGLQSSRLVRDYDFALRLSRLISENVIIDANGSAGRFVDFSEDDATMHKLFEDFVFNFYLLERPEWRPNRRQISWFDARGSADSMQYLPSMHTDVYLTVGNRQIVLDAKFYSKPLDGWHGDGVRSAHLYQLFSYVVNAAAEVSPSTVEGVLLYAAVDKPFAFRFHLHSHRIDVRALDLMQDWRSIHSSLLHLVETPSPSNSLGIVNQPTLRRAKAALRERLAGADSRGYVRTPSANLVPDVILSQFEDDLLRGDGDELRMRFNAAHSSCALAVNTFAPFKARPHDLLIAGSRGATSIQFEKQLPIIPGRRPANLDVWIERQDEIVAVESKLLEYFAEKKPEFAPAYETLQSTCSGSPWWTCYQEVRTGAKQHLDRAQLLKHYFGLRLLQKRGESRKLTLLYLFWEPTNATEFEICLRHRREVEAFAAAVSGSDIEFIWMTYPSLWTEWRSDPALQIHVSNLVNRYSIAV